MTYMKKAGYILTAILVLIVGMSMMTGCTGSEEPSYCDSAFIKDMAKGLENRWDIGNNEPDDVSDEEHGENLKKGVQAELDKIGDYTTGTFEDTKLQEYAISYINKLNTQMEAMEYYDSDYSKCADMWQEAYDERCQLIIAINELYPLNIGDKYAEDLKGILDDGKKKNELDAAEKALKKEIKDADVRKEEDNLVMVLENTTGKDIESVEIDIEFFDKDDVKIQSDLAFIENWKKGEKTKVSFWAYDIHYDRYKITLGNITYKE